MAPDVADIHTQQVNAGLTLCNEAPISSSNAKSFHAAGGSTISPARFENRLEDPGTCPSCSLSVNIYFSAGSYPYDVEVSLRPANLVYPNGGERYPASVLQNAHIANTCHSPVPVQIFLRWTTTYPRYKQSSSTQTFDNGSHYDACEAVDYPW
ncbi:MAG: hypothetical protein M1830_005292 [Pleopsidium flavum]|nr:MAG: hypothetical protein M1830_005292 [Pleopsidium flavum]